MFELVTMKDDIKLAPESFGAPVEESVRKKLNQKLANKVFYKHGLCIMVYDILEIGDSLILAGDGSCYTQVTFRCVVFRPFKDEILVGQVRSCNQDGIRVSVDFFDDIFIPVGDIQTPNEFRNEAGRPKWVWMYGDEEDEEAPVEEMVIEPGNKIRFRVKDEIFENAKPKMGGEEGEVENHEEKVIPYKIMATIEDDGLGPVGWWS